MGLSSWPSLAAELIVEARKHYRIHFHLTLPPSQPPPQPAGYRFHSVWRKRDEPALEEDHHIQSRERQLSTAFAPSWKLVERDRSNDSARKVHPAASLRRSCHAKDPNAGDSLHALCAWMGQPRTRVRSGTIKNNITSNSNNNNDGRMESAAGPRKSLKNEISFVTTSNQFSLELHSDEGRPRFSWTRSVAVWPPFC